MRQLLGMSSLVVSLIVIFTACGGTEVSTATATPDTTASVAEESSNEAAPTEAAAETETQMIEIDEEAGVTTASGLQIIEEEAGEGENPVSGDIVAVHYTGMLLDGTVFDSSLERGQPIEFRIGRGQVIPGWDEGIALLKPGGKARLVIPPELAYGEQGAGGSIPPNSTLVFDVELVSVTEGPPGAPEAPQVVDATDYTETETGLQYHDLTVGEGEAAESGQRVTVHYTGWLTSGLMFDSSLERGQPFELILGAGRVIPGWEEGVVGMQVGGTRQLVIPSELAYGEQGAGGGVIPPGATLIFEVALLELAEGPPGAPDAPQVVAESDYTETDSGLLFYDFEVGDGATPQVGQAVQVHYTGWLTDGTKFDSSLDRGDPISFAIGEGQVIPGWDEGVGSMRVGGQRQLVIPAELGYGERGAGGVIPPGATLIFEVELVGVE